MGFVCSMERGKGWHGSSGVVPSKAALGRGGAKGAGLLAL